MAGFGKGVGMRLLQEAGKFEILAETPGAVELIEKAARKCHQSFPHGDPDSFVRMLIRRGYLSALEHASVTVNFMDHSRGFTHELVRHRLASFSQESTRYVKQDDLHFVVPQGYDLGKIDFNEGFTPKEAAQRMETVYASLLAYGWKPEDARQFLPIGTTSEIVMTTNFREWRHVFELRCSKHAHWEIRRTMRMLHAEFVRRWPTVFDSVIWE